MWKDLNIGEWYGPDPMVIWGKVLPMVSCRKLIVHLRFPRVKHSQVTKEMAAAPLPQVEDTGDDKFEGRAEIRASLLVYPEG